MDIQYPKDTPQWLIDTIKRLGEEIQNNVINTPPEQFLVVKGETRLYRRLCEEIDAEGLLQSKREKELNASATRRE